MDRFWLCFEGRDDMTEFVVGLDMRFKKTKITLKALGLNSFKIGAINYIKKIGKSWLQ